MIKNLVFSCVVDDRPLFKAQAYILINSLIVLNDIEPSNIYVHAVNSVDDEFYKWLKNIGVNIIDILPFSTKNAYCNKLQQFKTFLDLEYDYVFFMDCDTAVSSLICLDLQEDVYAKIVDFPNPPEVILKTIFKKVNLDFKPYKSTLKLNNQDITDINNCNGGLYIISKEFLKVLAPKWIDYATWSLNNDHLFTKNYSKHADQVGFALAMASLNKDVTHLGIEWNYPTHIHKKNLPNIKPNIIHFHNTINPHMCLKKFGLNKVDEEINKINTAINEQLEKSLDNSLFWDSRYTLYPELGSGVGSRGEILKLKKNIINYTTYSFLNQEVIDVGCGDLELTKDFKFEKYLGLDVSNEATKICKRKRSDWDFKNLSIGDESVSYADLIMCFDVLIHQSREEDFKNLVAQIVSKANKRIIVGAYNVRPEYYSEITHFYNGIFNEINSHAKFNEIGIVTKYRDVSVVVATLHESTHARDIKSEELNIAFTEVKRPDLLQYLVDVSRANFEFYTSHYPRVFEYTWLLEKFENKKSMQILDIGAGVCPLPICLAELGHKVTTVDSHPLKREIKDKENWNEWGFLDYNKIDKRITSKNLNFGKFKTFKKYDCIYSISVIEHMPRVSRLKVLKKVSRILKKHGKLLLTIDIEPNTNNIWNFSEGKPVESQEIHGTVESFKKELNDFGFKINSENMQRNINNSRTDVWYVVSTLNTKPLL